MQQTIEKPRFNEKNSSIRKHQLTVRLPAEIFQHIESKSEKMGISLAEVVRRYLKRGIKQ